MTFARVIEATGTAMTPLALPVVAYAAAAQARREALATIAMSAFRTGFRKGGAVYHQNREMATVERLILPLARTGLMLICCLG
jgi:hypothetical protein